MTNFANRSLVAVLALVLTLVSFEAVITVPPATTATVTTALVA